MDPSSSKTQYFIAKVGSIQSLRTCIQTGRWACKDKSTPPQPRHLLTEACSKGRVVIIFSVNNCHGWHGYADMISTPCDTNKLNEAKQDIGQVTNDGKKFAEENADVTSSPGNLNEFYEGKDNVQVTIDDKMSAGKGAQAAVVVIKVGDNLNNMSLCGDSSGEGNDIVNMDTKDTGDLSSPREYISQFEQDCLSPNRGTDVTDSIHQQGVLGITNTINTFSEKWHYFQIQWKLNYLSEFGEQCLSFKLTDHFKVDGILLNKCRNWQTVPADTGEAMCTLMKTFYETLCLKREEKIQKQVDSQPPPFYKDDTNVSSEDTWRKIVKKVDADLGKVILACPFGSQRYNLSIPTSDTDMFIVYQAHTRSVLGFHPPKQTIKNSEHEVCDYTIHEVFRYSELLLSGDARCVETLFLDDTTIVQSSPQWQELQAGRQLLLNKECLNKYLRDAQGSKGTKYLKKWCDDNKNMTILPPKMCKMLYVIVRLLQNARNIADQEDLKVYRKDGSVEKELLMFIRAGNVPVARAWEIIRELEGAIAEKEESVPEKNKDLETFLEGWLLKLRHDDVVDSDIHVANNGLAL